MERTLKFLRVSRYGRDDFIPRSETASDLCEFAKLKSLSEKRIDTLKKIGFKIHITEATPYAGNN